MKQYDYQRAAELESKAQKLLRLHRAHLFKGDEAAEERHRRAIERIHRLMGPYWRMERNYRIGLRLLALYD